MDEEIWKPIGIEKYMISNWGNVKGIKGEKQMKAGIVGNGHCQVAIRKDGETKYFYIHRLVGEHFLEPPTAEKYLIDHIDRNKTNNHLSNLRWVSHQENCNNRYDSREPTEAVLKQRARCRLHKMNNPEQYKTYQSNYVLNGGKNKIAKENRIASKELMIKKNDLIV